LIAVAAPYLSAIRTLALLYGGGLIGAVAGSEAPQVGREIEGLGWGRRNSDHTLRRGGVATRQVFFPGDREERGRHWPLSGWVDACL